MKKRIITAFFLILTAIICVSALLFFQDTHLRESASLKPTANDAAQTRSVKDMYGREMVVPAKIKTIAAIGFAARILTYAGATDMIVGLTEMDKKNTPEMPYTVVNAKKFANLVTLGNGGASNTISTEELVILQPDIIIAAINGDKEELETIAAKTGIPVLGLAADNIFDESFYRSLELIGQITGREEHCAKTIEYVKKCQKDLNERTKALSDAAKPSVYAGAIGFRGGHGFRGTFRQYPPFTAINAKNVADETGAEGFVMIDLEKLAVWNPDIIFLNPANMRWINEDYEKNRRFFDNLDAIKNGRIYSQLPYNYNYSNMEIAIANAYYAGKIIFPAQFEDIDPVKKADEIFTVMLGEPFYEKLAAIGLKFEKMTIVPQP